MLGSEVRLEKGQTATLKASRSGTEIKFELEGGLTELVHEKPGRQVQPLHLAH